MPNKKTRDHLRWMDMFLEKNRQRFEEVFNTTSSARAVLEAYLTVLTHRVPKASDMPALDLDRLSELPESTLDELLDALENLN